MTLRRRTMKVTLLGVKKKKEKKKECNYSRHDGLAEASYRDIRCLVLAAGDATIVIVIS